MAIRHHIPARMRVWAGTTSIVPRAIESEGWLGRDLGPEKVHHRKSAAGAVDMRMPVGGSDAPRPSEPIVMVPRADLYGGRVLLTGSGYDPEAAAIAPVEAGEFDRPTTIAGWKSYFNDLAGKPPE